MRMIDSASMGDGWIPRIVLAAGCAALVAGCGGGGGGDEGARDAAEAYVQARSQGDAAKVCELYSTELISRLGASNCQAFVKEQTGGVATSFTLIGVTQSDGHATATIKATAAGESHSESAPVQITLERQDGAWKITSLGKTGHG